MRGAMEHEGEEKTGWERKEKLMKINGYKNKEKEWEEKMLQENRPILILDSGEIEATAQIRSSGSKM